MNYKQFLKEVEKLRKLNDEDKKTLTLKYKIWKQHRVVNKLIHQAAKSQSDIVYKQTCVLYQDIVKSNLE